MAGKEGVDILVFPEFGLGGDFTSRDSLFPFVENIPDATQPVIILFFFPANKSFNFFPL